MSHARSHRSPLKFEAFYATLANMSLDEFFTRYAAISLGPQPKHWRGFMAQPSSSPDRRVVNRSPTKSRFLEWLRQVADFNRQHGMQSLAVVSIQDMPLSPLHRLATVRWGTRFEKTGDRVIEFEISYLLRRPRTGGGSSGTSPVAIRRRR